MPTSFQTFALDRATRVAVFAALAFTGYGGSLLAQPAIYRCGSSYTQTSCPGGHAIGDSLSTLHGSTQAAPGQATVYLCKGQGGGQFWSRSHCNEHHAAIERMETVPASLPWSQQVQQAQTQWEQTRDPQYGAPPSRHHSASKRAAEARARARETRTDKQEAQQIRQQTAACSSLRARLAQLDSQGRTGQQSADMERLRSERRQARNEYRRLGC